MEEKSKKSAQKEIKEKEIENKILNYKQGDMLWYKKENDIVKKRYMSVAAAVILKACKGTKRVPYADVDKLCEYNPGDRLAKRKELGRILKDVDKIDNYILDIERGSPDPRMEERMCHILFAQQFVSDFEVLDYQIPTTNNPKIHDNIDLLLKKGDVVYMTETKKFSTTCKRFGKEVSKETLIRCVLEIQTYYQKINNKFFDVYKINDKTKLKKAVLLDEDMEAYKELSEPWAKDLLDLFDITVLKLERVGAEFRIEKI